LKCIAITVSDHALTVTSHQFFSLKFNFGNNVTHIHLYCYE